MCGTVCDAEAPVAQEHVMRVEGELPFVPKLRTFAITENLEQPSLAVIPAKAGIHVAVTKSQMDSGLRRNDGIGKFFEIP